MFEKLVLSRIFGPKREEEIGRWRRTAQLVGVFIIYTHQEALRVLRSLNQDGEIGGTCSTNLKNKEYIQILVGIYERKLGVDGKIILSHLCVTIDGVWIGDWIY
jgi:hypothetical protein